MLETPPDDSELLRKLNILGRNPDETGLLYKLLYNYLRSREKTDFINNLSDLSRYFIEYHNRRHSYRLASLLLR